jgi:hypothetical protein
LIRDIVSLDGSPCYIDKLTAYDESVDLDGNNPIIISDWIALFKEVTRISAAKPLMLHKVLNAVSNCLQRMPEYKETDDIQGDKSFAKVWNVLSFVCNLSDVSGECGIRYFDHITKEHYLETAFLFPVALFSIFLDKVPSILSSASTLT